MLKVVVETHRTVKYVSSTEQNENSALMKAAPVMYRRKGGAVNMGSHERECRSVV